MSTIDLVKLMIGNPVDILKTRQAASDGEIMCPWLNGPAGQIWEMKNAAGWPADGYAFDEQFIYQTVTEIDDAAHYGDPRSYKKFTASPGIVWMPRYYQDASEWEPVQSPSQYLTVLGGIAQPLKDLGGPVEVEFAGPYVGNFGKLGQQSYYLQSYKWGADFSTMEQNCYVMGLGRIQWQLLKMTNGHYVVAQTTLFDTSASGPCPKLAFVA